MTTPALKQSPHLQVQPMLALDASVLPELIGYDQAALDAAGVSLVIVDALAPDQPVCWVSPGFIDLTGFVPSDVLGRNCRFLQVPTTSPAARTRMREALAAGEPIQEMLLNRRADGSVFWNELLMAPVRSKDAQVTHFVGYQVDASAAVKARAAHERFLHAEHRARHLAARSST